MSAGAALSLPPPPSRAIALSTPLRVLLTMAYPLVETERTAHAALRQSEWHRGTPLATAGTLTKVDPFKRLHGKPRGTGARLLGHPPAQHAGVARSVRYCSMPLGRSGRVGRAEGRA
jgi:hypothetical protein